MAPEGAKKDTPEISASISAEHASGNRTHSIRLIVLNKNLFWTHDSSGFFIPLTFMVQVQLLTISLLSLLLPSSHVSRARSAAFVVGLPYRHSWRAAFAIVKTYPTMTNSFQKDV